MNIEKYPDYRDEIEELIGELQSSDGLQRQKARVTLVEMGWQAVPQLVKAMADTNEHARWEAAKALGDIEDPSAALALVHALEDESQDVRGVAAESLICMERAAVLPLLQELTKKFESVWLRQGAHHVLHILKNNGLLTQPEIEVFEALEDVAPEVEVPWAAERALKTLQINDR